MTLSFEAVANQRNLEPPARRSLPVKSSALSAGALDACRTLLRSLSYAGSHVSKPELWAELDILLRVIYKNKNAHRNSKHFQLLALVAKLTKRLRSCAVRATLKETGSLFVLPAIEKSQPQSLAKSGSEAQIVRARLQEAAMALNSAKPTTCNLPTLAMVHYTLGKLGAAGLLCRYLHVACVRCSALLADSIQHGRFIPIMITFLSSVARMDVLVRQLELDLAEVYRAVVSWKALVNLRALSGEEAPSTASSTGRAANSSGSNDKRPRRGLITVLAVSQEQFEHLSCPDSLTPWLDGQLGARSELHGLAAPSMDMTITNVSDKEFSQGFTSDAYVLPPDELLDSADIEGSDEKDGQDAVAAGADVGGRGTSAVSESASLSVKRPAQDLGNGPDEPSKHQGAHSVQARAVTKRARLDVGGLDAEDVGVPISGSDLVSGASSPVPRVATFRGRVGSSSSSSNSNSTGSNGGGGNRKGVAGSG